MSETIGQRIVRECVSRECDITYKELADLAARIDAHTEWRPAAWAVEQLLDGRSQDPRVYLVATEYLWTSHQNYPCLWPDKQMAADWAENSELDPGYTYAVVPVYVGRAEVTDE